MATVAEHIAGRLYERGVRHAFGIPGGEVLAVMDALRRVGIAFHLVKHETAGGFMADAVAQLTGAPGVLVGTLGPGVGNLVNAVANAYLERTPMVVVTACIDPGVAGNYTHQIFDQTALLAPITKLSVTLTERSAAALVDRAVALTTSGAPGPVHLNVPTTVAGAVLGGRAPAPLSRRGAAGLAESDELRTLVRWIEQADRPLILAGLGILHHRAHEALAAFAERAGAAVITTYKAKGVVPEDAPCVIGGAGLSPVADRGLTKALHAADLVLALGYDPVEMRDSWIQPWDPRTNSAEIGWAPRDHEVHRTKLEFVADLRVALEQITARIANRAGTTWPDGLPSTVRMEVDGALRPPGAAWGPHAVIETVRRVFPRETLATVDTGAHRILLSHVWPCHEPFGLLQSTGLATMGYGLPAAIGAKLARPERPVVCFTGDGGLEMVIGELATLRDLRLPVTIVCFADQSLALIELKQRRLGLPNLGVDAPATDFAAIADAYGGHGVRVRSRAELEAACRAALSRATFTLIEALVDKAEYAQQM